MASRKIDDLIKDLQELKQMYGNLPVVVEYTVDYNDYIKNPICVIKDNEYLDFEDLKEGDLVCSIC